jgi:hypothetical protein
MYENWHYHRNQSTRYQNRVAESEIRHAYDSAITSHSSRSATVDGMTSVIENQVRQRSYVSWHLIGRAVDVRTRYMSGGEERVFDSLARSLRLSPLSEEDHVHLQFP